MTFAEYRQLDAVSCSAHLKPFHNRTDAEARYALTHAEDDTDSLRVGHATHAAILEPDRFAVEYVKAPSVNMRTNAGKAEMEAFRAAHPSACALTDIEYSEACAMRDAVWASTVAASMLSGAGKNEAVAVWRDAATGLLCKARPDRLTVWDGYPCVIDIKTARDVSMRGFARACADFLYHMQAAWYLDGLMTLDKTPLRFIHIVVGKSPPHVVALRELGDPEIRQGRALARRYLDRYAACTVSGIWAGYPDAVDVQELPKFAYEDVDPNS